MQTDVNVVATINEWIDQRPALCMAASYDQPNVTAAVYNVNFDDTLFEATLTFAQAVQLAPVAARLHVDESDPMGDDEFIAALRKIEAVQHAIAALKVGDIGCALAHLLPLQTDAKKVHRL